MGGTISGKRRFWILVFSLLILPVLIFWKAPLEPKVFNSLPLDEIRNENPGLMLIGNSNMEYGVDVQLLSRNLKDLKIRKIYQPGSTSMFWFLAFKNYVVASKIHPLIAVIFFVDRNLTTFPFPGENRDLDYIKMTSLPHEPDLDRLLKSKSPVELLRELLKSLYLSDHFSEALREAVDFAAIGIAGIDSAETYSFKNALTQLFSIERLKRDLPPSAEGTDTYAESLPFEREVSRSLLPELVRLSHESNVRLIFVRMRRKPDADKNKPPGSAELESYIRHLSEYLRRESIPFLDFTDAKILTRDLYLDADHLGEIGRGKFTNLLSERLRELIK